MQPEMPETMRFSDIMGGTKYESALAMLEASEGAAPSERTAAMQPHSTVLAVCETCGTSFKIPRYRQTTTRFCSCECRYRLNRGTPQRNADGSYSVPLTHGRFAIVDACDIERVAQHSWCTVNTKHGRYAQATIPTEENPERRVYMHRFLMDAPDSVEVDHENGDKLDNRRSNLRLCTRAQNSHNTGLTRANTSGFKGVSFCKQTGRWVAQIQAQGRYIKIGRFDTPNAAACAYDTAARKYQGEFARLNFPRDGERGVS